VHKTKIRAALPGSWSSQNAGSSVRTTRMRCDAYVNTAASEKDTYEKKLV